MADDILNELATACTCGPLDADGACLPCCARKEIERLRVDLARLGSFLHPIGEEARRG